MTNAKILPRRMPSLTPGQYSLKVTLKADISETDKLAPSITRKFTVAGERLALKPSDVEAVYPPAGSLGDHSDDLPHIVLNRSTLPWERWAGPAPKNLAEGGIPWLALLLFDEQEGVTSEQVSLDRSDREVAEGTQGSERATVIRVPRGLLEKILPTAADMKYLTHVRAAQGEDGPQERAVVVGNRLPKPYSTSIVHLVSMEGRYTADGKFDFRGARGEDLVRLVSLYSWRFACEDQRGNFTGLLETLNAGMLRLSENANPDAEKYLAMGCTALPHGTRQGTKTISWYHGPLVPGANMAKETAASSQDSDELLRFNASLGLFDVSYAAAWELGRFLALQSKTFSMELFNWKRSNARNRRMSNAAVPALEVPPIVRTWFEELDHLKGVPFNYLVPDQRMLPPESLRFFFLDWLWLDRLLDGAFSIGRVTQTDGDLHGALKANLLSSLEDRWSAPSRMITGFLLRSEVVAGWPGLLVDGQVKATTVKPLLLERLTKDILLCLFDGKLIGVDIYLKPEAMHFGVDGPDAGSTKYYILQEKSGTKLDIPWQDDGSRVIDIKSLTGKGKLDAATSAEFASQMIEPVEKVRFRIKC